MSINQMFNLLDIEAVMSRIEVLKWTIKGYPCTKFKERINPPFFIMTRPENPVDIKKIRILKETNCSNEELEELYYKINNLVYGRVRNNV